MTDLPGEVADRPGRWPVDHREELARGRVISLVRETVRTPDGEAMVRDWVPHPGAVAVVALDEDDRVVVLRQYRHPVGATLVELPAGLLDAEGEDWVDAARRELAEEAELAAEHWEVLVDLFTTPGSSDESVRIYLARGLRPADRPQGFVLEGEEAHLEVGRVPLADLVAAVLAGRVQNPLLVAGVLAAHTLIGAGRPGRPADAPWPARSHRAAPPEPRDGGRA